MAQLSLTQALQLAVQNHQAGNLPQAEGLYRQILAAAPNHVEALHLLGVLATQVGRHDAGLALIDRAIALEPGFFLAMYNRGNILRDLKRYDAALASYRQALELKEESPEVYNNIASIYQATGRLDDAAAAYGRAIALQPNYFEAHNNLGNVFKDQRKIDEAIGAYRRALAINVQSAEAWSNLCVALEAKGEIAEAIAAGRQAVALKPALSEGQGNLAKALFDDGQFELSADAARRALALKPTADAYNNLGSALTRAGRLDEAIAAFRQALALYPPQADILSNLGAALHDKGQLVDAVAALRQSLAINPESSEALNNLANTLRESGDLEDSIAVFRRALALRPEFAEALSNLAVSLQRAGKIDESIATALRAMSLKSAAPAALNNLGVALKDQGRLDEALAAFRQAMAVDRDDYEAHSNLVFDLHYHADYDAAAIAEELRLWNVRHAEPLRQFIRPHGNSRDAERRLRIGLVSPDLREHPVARFLLPVVANLDKSRFEVAAYSQVSRPDGFTERLRGHTVLWRSTVGVSDGDVAEMIRGDGVDILVDLAMHTAGHRLLVFARKPAPVQVCWLGYPGSTGMTAMDYRFSDRFMDPAGGDESVYAEKTFRLPDCFWCYAPPLPPPPAVAALPAVAAGHVTFGCLNNFCKVTPPTLAAFAAILQAVPGSRLLLHAREGSHRGNLLKRVAELGVDPVRVRFLNLVPAEEYFALYNQIDVALDTYPYCGGTTSCDALWMGVPVVTRGGGTAVSRGGTSIVSNCGLPELAGGSQDEFVEIASGLAGDLGRLAALRKGLRGQMEASPLMDAPRFARGMEEAFRQMWRGWCLQG